MTSEIQLFSYEDNAVRIIERNGVPYWVAKDVCDILGLSNTTEALKSLDDDEKGSLRISEGTSAKGGNPNMKVITESGLYYLIFRSSKPQAKEFRRWVTGTVLPQIRRTGSFSSKPEKLTKTIMSTARMILTAGGIKDNQLALALDKIAMHYTGESLLALSGVVLEAPTKHQTLNASQIGAHFGVSARKVNAMLANAGYQKKVGNGWEPLDIGEPFAVMVDTGKQHGNGIPIRQLRWDSNILDELEPFFENEETEA